MKKGRKLIITVIIIAVIITLRAVFYRESIETLESYEGFLTAARTGEIKYSEYFKNNKSFQIDNVDSYEFHPSTYNLLEGAILLTTPETEGYHTSAVRLNRGDKMEIQVDIDQAAFYQIQVDYLYDGLELFPPKFGIYINDEFPFYESRQTSVPLKWVPNVALEQDDNQDVYQYDFDRYGNDVQPRSEKSNQWLTDYFYDSAYYHQTPLQYKLDAGQQTITIESRNDDVMIGSITLLPRQEDLTYEAYKNLYQDHETFDDLIVLEAEYLSEKSDPSIKLYSDQRAASTPNAIREKRLNAIDAYTWDEAGRSVTWNIQVPKEGLYQISFKYIQYRLINISSFRKIEINGEVPFEALNAYPFPYSSQWKNETLSNSEEDYWFYLKEGLNTMTLTSTIEPYLPIVETLETVMGNITKLAIEIQQLTGGNTDTYRDWDLIEFIPDISIRLNQWADELEKAYQYGHFISNRERQSAELVSLMLAYNQLRELAEHPNTIPNQMTLLSEGPKSASQYLGDLILRLTRQSLGLEKIYLSGDQNKLPVANANIFSSGWRTIRMFLSSFRPPEAEETDPEKTIEVWVNRPRANIDLMQKMIDELFTPETGIHVNLSLMPNPTKLILSNAANIEPDVAMGVSSQTPYNFAIRNAAEDLRQYDGYEEIVDNFAKGSMIPYVYDQGVYGFPETQDFFVTFYRTDILSYTNSPIPQTWDEVIGMLPELRRLGMNYYIPLSSANAYKTFNVTIPFFYQIGADLYSDDGMYTEISSDLGIEAVTLMSQLFSVHDLPVATSSFYNHFRYGTLPIGVANSSTYLQLLIAAPEIKGNWDIALHPGVYDSEEDVINRSASGATTATMIFKSSDKSELAFDFLQWWHSTETQSLFSNDIQKMFGKEYMWFSSNLNVLASLPIDAAHKDIILEQLEWVVEAPNMPGGYFVEREISNAWNSIVISDENVRSAVDNAAKNADRELWRKMIEFGYVVDNKKYRDYLIPTINNIDDWLTERSGS